MHLGCTHIIISYSSAIKLITVCCSDVPASKDNYQLAELKDVVENELLLLRGELSVLCHYRYQLTDDLQEAIVQHEGWHPLHHLKQLEYVDRGHMEIQE